MVEEGRLRCCCRYYRHLRLVSILILVPSARLKLTVSLSSNRIFILADGIPEALSPADTILLMYPETAKTTSIVASFDSLAVVQYQGRSQMVRLMARSSSMLVASAAPFIHRKLCCPKVGACGVVGPGNVSTGKMHRSHLWYIFWDEVPAPEAKARYAARDFYGSRINTGTDLLNFVASPSTIVRIHLEVVKQSLQPRRYQFLAFSSPLELQCTLHTGHLYHLGYSS